MMRKVGGRLVWARVVGSGTGGWWRRAVVGSGKKVEEGVRERWWWEWQGVGWDG